MTDSSKAQTSAISFDQAENGFQSAVSAYFDRLAPHWDESLVVDAKMIGLILDAAGVERGVRVLDVACGTGVLFPFYAARQAAHVTAVDLSPEMVKIARDKTDDSRFTILCADVESLTPTEAFDCCVVYNAFPHFADPKRLIHRLAAWLIPGGSLTVAHGMSIDALNRHHQGSAAHVSRGMMPAEKLARLFAERFDVRVTLSDQEKYIVSGRLKGAAT